MSDRSGNVARIYVANADGSGVTPLTNGNAPAWSPDGTKIAFDRSDSIYVIDANGANERFLGAGFGPRWSPDGTQLAYTAGTGSAGSGSDGGIFVMDADGSNSRLLLRHEFASHPGLSLGDEYCVCSPEWSRDGRTILFARYTPYYPDLQLFTIDADGGGSPSGLLGRGSQPTSSPGGSRIAYVQPSSEIVSNTPSGDDLEVHVSYEAGYVLDPAWAPDGRSLLFTRSAPWGEPGTTRIFIVRDDRSLRQFIPEAQNPTSPYYSDWDADWSWAD